MIAKASDGAAIRIVFQGAGCASGLRSKNFESEMKGENTTDERPIFNNCDAEKTAEGKDSQRAGGGSDPVHAGGRCGGGAEKQAAAGSTAQYGGSAAGTKAVDGNKQRSLYGSAATVPYKDTATATYNNAASPSYSGNTASLYSGAVSTPYTGTVTAQYKSPEARPAVRSPNATPYGGAATAQYNSPAAAKPAVRKREKTPSELGDEVVARVLVEEGLMDPKDLEEYLASFEEPSARTFTDAGGSNIMGRGTNKLYSRQRDNGLVSPVQISGGNTGPIDPPPEWLAQMPMQDPDYPGLAAAANQAGFWLKDNKEWLAPEWLELMSMSNSDYPGLPAAANQAGFWLKDNKEWLAPEWLSLMSMSNSDYPGLPVFANQVGFGLKDKAEQLWGDTHLASGTSFDDYLQDKFRSGIYSGTEGAWNGLVDHGELYEKGWLLAQNAEMQGQALLNDAYREQAERNNMQTKEVLDELPEYSEGLRSHKAAEYAQQIDELYDAGGLCRIAGDFISSLGKRIPSILVGIFTGDVGKMGYQYFLIEGNAAAEARAGGADEETALLYGVVSGSVRMAMTKIGDVVTKLGDVVKLNDEKLNDWLMGMVQSKTGRTALRHLVGALGNGAKSFINKIAEEYFARMWNDDERGFWQTAGETLPDVIYQELIGILVNSILKVSPDTMPNTSE